MVPCYCCIKIICICLIWAGGPGGDCGQMNDDPISGSISTSTTTEHLDAVGQPSSSKSESLPGYSIIDATTEFKEKFVNIVPKVYEENIKVDGACFSHSPPFVPLEKYNRWRTEEFHKNFLERNFDALLDKKVANRENFFEKVHRTYATYGEYEYCLNMNPRGMNRSSDGDVRCQVHCPSVAAARIHNSKPGNSKPCRYCCSCLKWCCPWLKWSSSHKKQD